MIAGCKKVDQTAHTTPDVTTNTQLSPRSGKTTTEQDLTDNDLQRWLDILAQVVTDIDQYLNSTDSNGKSPQERI